MEDLKGLKELNRMGKSWFVLYKYYKCIDHNEIGWKNCSTVQMRINIYENTRQYHLDWLNYIIFSSTDKLSINQLGKSGLTINKMAREIYNKISKNQ